MDASNVQELRRLIDTSTPIVYGAGWDRLAREGWRFATNLYLISQYHNKKTIEEHIRAHGPLNVALGQWFDKNNMKPAPHTEWCGLYVRDVDIQIEQMGQMLDDTEAVSRWLTN